MSKQFLNGTNLRFLWDFEAYFEGVELSKGPVKIRYVKEQVEYKGSYGNPKKVKILGEPTI